GLSPTLRQTHQPLETFVCWSSSMSLHRIFALKCLVALAIIVASGVFEPAISADPASFDKTPSFNPDIHMDFSVVGDEKKMFTASFLGLRATLESTPIVSRSFSFSLPISGVAPGTEIPFFVSSYAFVEKGASAHLIFMVNDQVMVVHFSEENDSVQEFKYK